MLCESADLFFKKVVKKRLIQRDGVWFFPWMWPGGVAILIAS